MITYLALRIDVDTHAGLTRGLPILLDELDRRDLRASIFLPTGPDVSALALARILSSPKRLIQMFRLRPGGTSLPAIALSGIVFPARPISQGLERLKHRLAGHELALHGHDHWRWIHNISRWSKARVETEISRGLYSFNRVFGTKPMAFGAPGWRTTPAALAALDQFHFTYASDCRGVSPFFPEGSRTLQLPTTLPTLEENLRVARTPIRAFLARIEETLSQESYHCYCLHCETEGLRFPDFLGKLLDVATRKEVQVGPLGAVLPHAQNPPVCRMIERQLLGRFDPVAWQVDI